MQNVKRIRAVNQEELDQVRQGGSVIEPAFIDRYPEVSSRENCSHNNAFYGKLF